MATGTIILVIVLLCFALFVGFAAGWAIRGDMEASHEIWKNKYGSETPNVAHNDEINDKSYESLKRSNPWDNTPNRNTESW